LRHAISLNSMMLNLARIVGPGLAGILIALVGAGWCFGIDALSYVAVIGNLFQMRFPPRLVRQHAEPLKAVLHGFAYAWGSREIRVSLLLIGCASVFGGSYLSMLPAFARDILHQGSEGLGFLYGAIGGAALLAAYVLARVPDRHLFATPVAATLSLGVALILFSRSHLYWLSFVLLMPAGFSLMLLGGSTNSIVQLASRDDMRGRVISFYVMCVGGMTPWGSLLLGWVAGRLGVADAVTIGGAVCVLAGLAAWYDRSGESWKLRPAE
jgi:MFS family permease